MGAFATILASAGEAGAATGFPLPLGSYADPSGQGLLAVLASRAQAVPFNLAAAAVFLLAIVHTFSAHRFRALAHRMQARHDEAERIAGRTPQASFLAELMDFFGEVEVIFGLWAVVLLGVITAYYDWPTAKTYIDETVDYTEPLFVVVIMALAGTRPVLLLAEAVLRRFASLGRGTPAAWWFSILTVGPLLGSLITEPAAMTISALLLRSQFYALRPRPRLAYATLGLLFVNVSVGGTLTHFAAPPVLMVSRTWEWGTVFMLQHFGWKAAVAILTSNTLTFLLFRRELGRLRRPESDSLALVARVAVPMWIVLVHVLFLAFTVLNSHYPALFIAGFLFFLGFAKATAPYQSVIDLKGPLLVGFFLGGLVIHGGLQGWWIGPTLRSLSDTPLFFGAAGLTAFNDNALITYLATLVPNLSESIRYAVVAGAVAGGGLTVIANAPNPAGQAILGECFEDGISPLGLLAGAIGPTLVAVLAFLYLPS
jgi:hypothetical protein